MANSGNKIKLSFTKIINYILNRQEEIDDHIDDLEADMAEVKVNIERNNIEIKVENINEIPTLILNKNPNGV